MQSTNLNIQFKNLSLYLLSTFISATIGIIINPFLAANLSPSDYAIIGYFSSFNLLIVPIISFSLHSYYSRNYYRIAESDRLQVLDTIIISQLVLGFIGLIVVFIGFYVFMRVSHVGFSFFPYAILCFAPNFFSCFYSLFLIEKRMKRQAKHYFWISVVNSILGTLFALLFVVILKKGAIGRFWGILLSSFLVGMYGFFSLISSIRFNKKVLWNALSFSWPISLSAILYYFIAGVDRAFLEKLNDVTTFGIYNVAVQIAQYLYLIYTALNQTFEPDIYQSIAQNNRRKLMKIVTVFIILNTIPVVLFIVFANPIVRILTYGRYTESTVFAQIVAIKNIPMAICFLISNIIIGFGYTKVELINRVIGACLAIFMFKILIDEFGFYGAAWGQSISFILMTLISVCFLVYKLLIKKGASEFRKKSARNNE